MSKKLYAGSLVVLSSSCTAGTRPFSDSEIVNNYGSYISGMDKNDPRRGVGGEGTH